MGFLLYDLYFDIAWPLSPHNDYIVEVVMDILLVYIAFAMISLIFPGLTKLSKLLQHCNMTMTMPITFVSDCSTETYTEANEREHSRKHEQATCVPITFIDGAMINLILKHRWRIP